MAETVTLSGEIQLPSELLHVQRALYTGVQQERISFLICTHIMHSRGQRSSLQKEPPWGLKELRGKIWEGTGPSTASMTSLSDGIVGLVFNGLLIFAGGGNICKLQCFWTTKRGRVIPGFPLLHHRERAEAPRIISLSSKQSLQS